MKSILKITFLLGLFMAFALQSEAQIQTPSASPSAKSEYMVGLTKVTIEYSRPSKKGREIFGGLVPYGEAWRTGANSATKITFSEDVIFGGQELAAGSYAILTKPMKTEWQFMVYPYASGNWGSYLNADVEPVTFTVPSGELPFEMETFTIDVGHLRNKSARVWFLWDRTSVGVELDVHTAKQVEASIEKTMAGPSAGDYYSAASYYLDEGKDMETALMWINKSIEMDNQPKFWVMRRKALIQAELGDYKGAVATAKRSKELAMEAGNNQYVQMNEASIKEWSMK